MSADRAVVVVTDLGIAKNHDFQWSDEATQHIIQAATKNAPAMAPAQAPLAATGRIESMAPRPRKRGAPRGHVTLAGQFVRPAADPSTTNLVCGAQLVRLGLAQRGIP